MVTLSFTLIAFLGFSNYKIDICLSKNQWGKTLLEFCENIYSTTFQLLINFCFFSYLTLLQINDSF